MLSSSEVLLLKGTGLRFAYLDSGPPKDKADYPTLFFLHGLSFNAATFGRLLPLKDRYGARVIAVHRRGYEGTSPLNETEVSVLNSGSSESRAAFIRSQGVELALVLNQLSQKLRLPESGGVTVVGWSLGNMFLYALLAAVASPTLLPSESRQRLQSCIKRVVIYDVPMAPNGLSVTTEHHNPFNDPSIPPEEKGTEFLKWVSSFWDHPDLASRSLDGLNSTTPSSTKKPTVESIPEEELQAITDVSAGDIESAYLLPDWIEVLASLRNEVLFSESFRNGWKGLPKALWLYGNKSTWEILYTTWTIQDMVKEKPSHFDIKFQELDGANHFAMLEEPDRFLQVLLTS